MRSALQARAYGSYGDWSLALPWGLHWVRAGRMSERPPEESFDFRTAAVLSEQVEGRSPPLTSESIAERQLHAGSDRKAFGQARVDHKALPKNVHPQEGVVVGQRDVECGLSEDIRRA